MITKRLGQSLVATTLMGVLVACGGDNNRSRASNPDPQPVMAQFRLSVTNLTANQPLSPIAAVVHSDGWSVFELGSPVSVELEELAEGGENAPFLASADEDANVNQTLSSAGAVAPGSMSSMEFEVDETDLGTLQLSVVSMLVNTNDAITALKQVDLMSLEVGDSMSYNTLSYDAGTEANTEVAASIPGPVSMGEGFNTDRDDVRDSVFVHPGAITVDDGLTGSALNSTHKWDNPVMRVTLERVE